MRAARLLLLGLLFVSNPALAGTASGSGALALAALVGDVSPSLSAVEKSGLMPVCPGDDALDGNMVAARGPSSSLGAATPGSRNLASASSLLASASAADGAWEELPHGATAGCAGFSAGAARFQSSSTSTGTRPKPFPDLSVPEDGARRMSTASASP